MYAIKFDRYAFKLPNTFMLHFKMWNSVKKQAFCCFVLHLVCCQLFSDKKNYSEKPQNKHVITLSGILLFLELNL